MSDEHLACDPRDDASLRTAVLAEPTASRRCTDSAWNDKAIAALVADRPVAVQHRLGFPLALDQELASITHDLRSLVTVIKVHTQFLQRHIASSKRAADALIEHGLAQMATTVARLSELLDHLHMLVGRQLDTRLHTQYQSADLATLVGQVVAEHQLLTRRHAILLLMAGPLGTKLKGRWDMPQLERALGNLISNATTYSLYGGEFVVEVGRERKARGTAAEEVDTAVRRVDDQGVFPKSISPPA
jgi:signal transduction histidine kinase